MKEAPRPYHHGSLREALLRAAGEALEARGVQAISLRELSRGLGVSHTSPRRHFADKQALLDALALDGFERLDAALGHATTRPGQNFPARLRGLARAYVGFASRHPALLGLMFEAKQRPDAPLPLLAAVEKAFTHGPATFAAAQAAGEVVPGDPVRLALVVSSALLGLVSMSTNGQFIGVPLDELTDAMIERMILGFQPRSSPPPRSRKFRAG